jgi:excisionase family DNA binding protein
MHSIAELLNRAIAWPRRAIGDQPVLTDRVSLHFSHISPTLKSEDILTPEEVAARLKVPPSWVYEKTRARCRNPIPCLRLGRYVRFDWNAVIKWLSSESQHNAERASLPQKRKLVR